MLDSLKTKLISVCNTLIPNVTYLICESVSSFHFKMRAGVKYLFSPHHVPYSIPLKPPFSLFKVNYGTFGSSPIFYNNFEIIRAI